MGTHGPIKYRFNDKFFDELDSDAKAYWLGFIAADGTVVRTQLSVSLATKDGDHLERFKADIAAEQSVKRYSYPAKNLEFVRLLLSSKRLAERLARWGVVPNKTFIFRMPAIPERFMGAFIRGVFDGDGSIHVSDGEYLRWIVSITANHGFASDIAAVLSETGIACRCRPGHGRKNSVSNIIIDARTSVIAFRDWIYNDAVVWLPRKRDKFNGLVLPDHACQQCGAPIEQTRFRARRKFCGKPCYQRWWRDHHG